MNTADYTGTSTVTGGSGKYPLSTETLDFIQEQISLLESIAGIGGGNYILRVPDGVNQGVAVVYNESKGPEILRIQSTPLFSQSVKYLTVTTEREDINADGETYVGARVLRLARFSSEKGNESYDINAFSNVSGKAVKGFPTNARLAAQIENMPQTVLNLLRDVLAEKLTAKTVTGLTQAQLDGLKTPCVLSCSASLAVFGSSEYTLVVSQQGHKFVRQEIIQGQDEHYVRTFNGSAWGAWAHQIDTTMHLDVKIAGTTVYLRHGTLKADCDIVLLRKKRRSGWRSTGGAKALTKNSGIRKKRLPKRQYVHFKGIRLSKGEPGKWYVPKCVGVADSKTDSNLIGKEVSTLCKSLFYIGADGLCRIQGCRKTLLLKDQKNRKGSQHRGYAKIGFQIARLRSTGGKDSGGEIVRLKYRIDQRRHKNDAGTVDYRWSASFSIE